MNILKLIAGVILVALLFQCNSQNQQAEAPAHEEGGHEEGVVSLTQVQISNAGVQTRSGFDTMNVSGFIKVNGKFDLPPENVASITAPMQGIVKQVNYLVGSKVPKGAVLVTLEHPEYIKLQEEYLTTFNNLRYLQEEYVRQKKLDSANIAARKAFRQAEINYQSAKARKLSLEKQLEYIGIDPSRVKAGKILSTVSVKAPFTGYVTKLNVHRGQFVDPQMELYELINKAHMHMELDVYEKDIQKIKKGLPITFTVPSLGTQRYQGEVFLIGHSFDEDTKTVKVHGHIHGIEPHFIRGLYLEALIFTGTEKVRALPEEAVIRDNGKNYIFISEEEDHENITSSDSTSHHADHAGSLFHRVEVVIGTNRNGMVEIKSAEEIPADTEIVVNGAYDLFSEMKKGEGGHHH